MWVRLKVYIDMGMRVVEQRPMTAEEVGVTLSSNILFWKGIFDKRMVIPTGVPPIDTGRSAASFSERRQRGTELQRVVGRRTLMGRRSAWECAVASERTARGASDRSPAWTETAGPRWQPKYPLPIIQAGRPDARPGFLAARTYAGPRHEGPGGVPERGTGEGVRNVVGWYRLGRLSSGRRKFAVSSRRRKGRTWTSR